jgi:hypothetical protein
VEVDKGIENSAQGQGAPEKKAKKKQRVLIPTYLYLRFFF